MKGTKILAILLVAVMSVSLFATVGNPGKGGNPFEAVWDVLVDLQEQIFQEIADRIADVDAEETGRIAADISLQNQIDTIELTPGPQGDPGPQGPQGDPDNDWTVSGDNMYSAVPGNVGIGTTNPLAKLSVGGDGFANTGVYGESSSGAGVRGQSYSNIGVYGKSTDDAAVLGQSTNGHGVAGLSIDQRGVYGYSENSYGVFGSSSSSYAGYFNGNVHVTGNLSKGSCSFKIDHPLDPENKFLQHSFVESPDMMNIYNGNATLDENGQAVVQLPEYFEALNHDFRYQLTCIGGFATVYIAEKISENHFKIAGGKPGMEVSWQVTGIRHDPYAVANRIAVEEDKPTEECGYYLHPKAYGLPEEKGIETVRNPRSSPQIRKLAKK